jgi:hypothetical protein
LLTVTELIGIERDGQGARYPGATGRMESLTGDEIVSMNMWGFMPTLFGHLRRQFEAFLDQRGRDEKSEFFIPDVISSLLNSGSERVRVLQTNDSWFGVTYREDRPRVSESLRRLIERGDYPERLWA